MNEIQEISKMVHIICYVWKMQYCTYYTAAVLFRCLDQPIVYKSFAIAYYTTLCSAMVCCEVRTYVVYAAAVWNVNNTFHSIPLYFILLISVHSLVGVY